MKYEEFGRAVGALVDQKNAAYGSAFVKAGDVLKVLYPDGIRPDQYVDLLGTVRVLDKLFRVANDKGAFGESPWKDVAGYGLLLGELNEQSAKSGTEARNSLPGWAPQARYVPEDN